jgi:Protein of unknown function (DUF3486)
MGIRSKVAMLPAAVRAQLDRLIVERAFSGYQALAEWLQAQGYRIADDSVQRYGVRLRRQLEALDFARHQAAALAAAGHSADETAEGLTAVTVQLLHQQVLSILLQAAQLDPSEQADAGEALNPSPADGEEAARAPGKSSAPVLTDAEPKCLDVRDLVRLTRITVDLNRIAKARDRRGDQLSSQRRQPAADQASAEAQGTELSEEAHQVIRNVLRDEPSIAPLSPGASSQPGETSVDSTQLVFDIAVAAEAQQSATLAVQPQLTADSRSHPHQKLDRITANVLNGRVWSALKVPSLGSLPQDTEQYGAA